MYAPLIHEPRVAGAAKSETASMRTRFRKHAARGIFDLVVRVP
jgi:hypothetical protein